MLALVGVCAAILGMMVLLSGSVRGAVAAPPDGAAYVHLLDRDSGMWVFTFTLPGVGADPRAVAVVAGSGQREVWFTEWGRDRIGRLTYTDTIDYAYTYYALTAGDRPLNLKAAGGAIWFTAPGGSYVGRLDPTTGVVRRFPVPVGSYPADLDVASDGSVWFTEMLADRLARLVITSPTTYSISEYFTPTMSGGRPYGIVAKTDGYGIGIFFAETANNRIVCFNPEMNGWKSTAGVLIPPVEPYALTLDGLGRVWGTERAGNMISQFYAGTLPLANRYSVTPAASLPTDIAADSSDSLWFTQPGAGQVGSLLPTAPPQKSYYPLPLADLTPMGIDVVQDEVWVVATAKLLGGQQAVYMPIAVRSYVFAPDLVVRSISARGTEITVVVANDGPAPVREEFWVEGYIDPEPVPTGVNQVWQDRCEQGAVWGVTASALPITPGQMLTLTTGDMYFWPGLSHLSAPLQVGAPVYAQVDANDISTTYGAVLETHEILKLAYNNITGPAYVTMAAGLEAIPAYARPEKRLLVGGEGR